MLLIHGFASSATVQLDRPRLGQIPHRQRLPRDCHRQSRPWRQRQALRSRALQRAADGRGCPPPPGPPRHPRADVMGYSMGARITAFLALAHPARVRSAIFGGLGGNMVRPMAGTGPIAECARGGVHRRREEPDGAHVPRLCRADRQRSESAWRPASAARAIPSRARWWRASTCPVLVAAGHGGRDRRPGRGAGRADPRRRRRCRSRAATTCWPSAIASTRRVCWRSCGDGPEPRARSARQRGWTSMLRSRTCHKRNAPAGCGRDHARDKHGGMSPVSPSSEMREQLTLYATHSVHTHFRATRTIAACTTASWDIRI